MQGDLLLRQGETQIVGRDRGVRTRVHRVEDDEAAPHHDATKGPLHLHGVGIKNDRLLQEDGGGIGIGQTALMNAGSQNRTRITEDHEAVVQDEVEMSFRVVPDYRSKSRHHKSHDHLYAEEVPRGNSPHVKNQTNTLERNQ